LLVPRRKREVDAFLLELLPEPLEAGRPPPWPWKAGYADQGERDYGVFVKAVRNGRLKSDLGPTRLATALR